MKTPFVHDSSRKTIVHRTSEQGDLVSKSPGLGVDAPSLGDENGNIVA